VLDGAGNEFACEVENATRDSLALAVKHKNTRRPALRHYVAAGRAQGENHREHHPEIRGIGRAVQSCRFYPNAW